EYIRRDIEGSDADTRRRAAADLVRGLCQFHEAKVHAIFAEFITAMLQNAQEWRFKDAAVFLVMAIAAKTKTTARGTAAVSQFVNLTEFYTTHVKPDLNPA